jgi:methyl-accepting chemotaxis protein
VLARLYWSNFVSWKDLSVSRKVIGAFALVLITTIALGLFAVSGLSRLDADANELRTNWLPSIDALGKFQYHITRYRSFQASRLMARPEKTTSEDNIRAKEMAECEEYLKKYELLATSGKEKELAQAVRASWEAYRPLDSTLIECEGAVGRQRLPYR